MLARHTLVVASLVGHAVGARAQAPPRASVQPPATSVQDLPVGFQVFHEYDDTRTLKPRRDFADAANGEVRYPMQVRVWYPARAAAGGKPMTLGEYFLLFTTREAMHPFTATDRATALGFIKGTARFALGRDIGDSGAVAVSALPVSARRDAPPATGKFPVIAVATDGEPDMGVLLCEALARRGYVVIATGRLPFLAALQGSHPIRGYDARMRDLEYVIARARRLPYADLDHLGIVGMNVDGITALLAQMRGMRADAVASIGGWEGMGLGTRTARASPYFDPLRFRVPYLLVLPADANPVPALAHDLTIWEDLKYARGEYLVVRELGSPYLMGANVLLPQAPEGARSAYRAFTRRVASFFDATLKGRADADRDTAWVKVDRTRDALRAVPNAEELEALMASPNGAQRLRDLYRDARRENPELTLFSVGMLNLQASRLARSRRSDESLTLLLLGAEAFPRSTAAHENLGNGYLQAADTTRAVVAFARALEVVAIDSTLAEADRGAARANLEQKVARLRGPR